MIKANELRIGNWLNWNEDYYQVAYIGETIGIDISKHSGEGATQKFQSNPIFSQDIKDILPIELTPEILEKAGFTHRSDHRGEGMMMDFRKGENAMIVYLEYEKNGGGWRTSHMSGRAKIPYLHQLQNLYFVLTGSELPIELTQVERSVATDGR